MSNGIVTFDYKVRSFSIFEDVVYVMLHPFDLSFILLFDNRNLQKKIVGVRLQNHAWTWKRFSFQS